LLAAARRVFVTGGGSCMPTDFDWRLRHWKTGGSGVTGQLMLSNQPTNQQHRSQ